MKKEMTAADIAFDVYKENSPVDESWVKKVHRDSSRVEWLNICKDQIAYFYPDLSPQKLGRAATELSHLYGF